MNLLRALPLLGALKRDIQPSEVRAFWKHMQAHYDTRIVDKRRAPEMTLVGEVLDLLGIQDRDRFLQHYTTTIARNIYVPFEVGVPSEHYDLWNQVVICVHEHQHVVQHDREGISSEVSYLTDSAARARWEAEAYRSNLELHFWRSGQMPSPRALAELLHNYGCSAADVDVATRALMLSAYPIRKGAVINEASHVAIDWLDTHVPRLRAKQPN